MSSFDTAIGIDAAGVNQVAAAVYRSIYPGIFKGSEKVHFGDAELTLDYDVTEAPDFVLSPPDLAEGTEIVHQHLAEAAELRDSGWEHSELAEAILTATQDNVFQIKMDHFKLTITDGDGAPATDMVQVTVIVQANSAGGELSLLPIKATAKAANPADQTLVQKFIIPRAMEMMKSMLSGITLPPVSIPGVKLTQPTLFIVNERLIGVANKAGKPVPTPPFDGTWPTSSFFMLLSQEMRGEIASLANSQLDWSGHDSGSVGSDLGGASYSASAAMHNANITAPPGDPTLLNVSVQVSGNVSAKVTFMCVPVGVNYNLKTNVSAITATIRAAIYGNRIQATVQKVDGFVIILEPSGSIIEKVISAITWPITQAVVAAFSPAITNAIEGINIPSFPVPSVPYDQGDVHLTIQPENLTLMNWNDYLAAVGNVTIS